MIKLGIISDIHSHEKSKKQQGGFYFPAMPDTPISQNPFAAVKHLIRKNNITFDYLLSPGDYAHQTDEKGLKSSWEQLKIITNEVNAKLLIGTIGNHDVLSRSPGDSFEKIKTFDYDFPVYKDADSRIYLNSLIDKSYYIIDDRELDIFFIVLNSCYDHWTVYEASHGKVRNDDLQNIKEAIENSPRKRKILMVHHHPIVHETGIYDTMDLIEGSEELLKSILNIDLVIHGHKHDFRFTQYKIFPKNLNILSSGSFACFKTAMRTGQQNTFHIVEFHDDNISNCTNQGIINTYLYDPTSGWHHNLSLQEGFGCHLELNEICNLLEDNVKKQSEKYVQWRELIDLNLELKYISSENRKKALTRLMDLGVIKRFQADGFNDESDIIIK